MRVFHRFLLPGGELMWRLPLPATRRFFAARTAFDDAVFELIRERREPRPEPDLIDHLLALHAEDGTRALTDAEIRDEAVTLLLAGHETTAQALTWTWHLLATNPAASVRLADELESVLGDRRPRSPTSPAFLTRPPSSASRCASIRRSGRSPGSPPGRSIWTG